METACRALRHARSLLWVASVAGGNAVRGWAAGRGPGRRLLGEEMAGEEMHPSGRRVGRRLLGGGMDLAAAENQVYLFMVIFGTILFATPCMIRLYRHCFSDRGGGYDPSAQLEMWEFQDTFDDMRQVKDPLELENQRGRKGQKKKKKKKPKEGETPGK